MRSAVPARRRLDEGRSVIREQEILCDNCGARIARITGTVPEEWERLHNLCSRCFAERAQKAVR